MLEKKFISVDPVVHPFYPQTSHLSHDNEPVQRSFCFNLSSRHGQFFSVVDNVGIVFVLLNKRNQWRQRQRLIE